MHDNEATDCCRQHNDLWEDIAFQSPLCELGERGGNLRDHDGVADSVEAETKNRNLRGYLRQADLGLF